MDWNRRSFLAAGLASGAVTKPVWAKPQDAALWEVQRDRSKVYLFGDGGPLRKPWRSARIEAALHDSAVLWKEVPAGGLGAALEAFDAGIDPFEPLSSWLSWKDRNRVAAAAAAVGVGALGLEYSKPWLAAQFLQGSFYAKFGFEQANSADSILPAIAKGAGKPIRAEFAEMAEVIEFASSLSRPAQIQSLLSIVDVIEAGPDSETRRASAWAVGDDSLETRNIGRWMKIYPDFYREVVVARNRRWPARIRTMLMGGGTSFVLVGGDHLLGPDSIQAQLALAGMTARRL